MHTQTPPEAFLVRVWPNHEGGARIEAYHLESERFVVTPTLALAAQWMDEIARIYTVASAFPTLSDNAREQTLTSTPA